MTDESPSRRRFLAALGSLSSGTLAGCGKVADVFPASDPPNSGVQSPVGIVRGRVVDTTGRPVVDAQVQALGNGGMKFAETRSGSTGRFSLSVDRPVWVNVRAEEHRTRVRPCGPGSMNRIVVPESDESAVLTFAGDTMFARRFYTEPSDRLNPRYQINPNNRRTDHERILSPLAPALTNADLTSVNLETPLTTRSLRHPEKLYAFASHPVAAEALADAGVDYATLGNNHAFDALGPGLRDTINALTQAGIGHSGAGESPDAAWSPHRQQAGDLDVALLSCTTITGDQYEINWTANGPTDRPVTITTDGESRTVPAGIGAARGTPERLSRAVRRANDNLDFVVVQVHGGEPYQRSPTDTVRRLTETAARNGADLVVNHHPHVTGGIERVSDAIVAWSLGNLVFDQRIWPTFQSYLLNVVATAEGVARVTADPVLLDGFIPYGVVGRPNRTITWQTLAESTTEATATQSGVAVGEGTQSTDVMTEQFTEAGAIYQRIAGWVAGVDDGRIRLGQNLLPTGDFESTDIDDQGYDSALWRYGRTFPTIAQGYGIDDSGGVRLRRVSGNRSRAIISNTRRIPVAGPLTVALNYRASHSGTEVELTWFRDTDGSALGRRSWSLSPTGGSWQHFIREADPPDSATHANILISLEPPSTGRRRVDIDEIRLIQWANRDVTAGREYDHLEVCEPATVNFDTPGTVETPRWSRIRQ